MDDGFRVNLTEVSRTSEVLSSKQSEPPRLASALDGVSSVDTGDPGVDGTIRGAVERSAAMLVRFGQALGQDAQHLRGSVDWYRSVDAQVSAAIADAARSLAEISQRIDLLPSGPAGSLSGQPGATPPDGQPMSSLGIAETLNTA
jgi:hypothetical protein